MKVGLIARAEDRGLGSLSRDFYDHMRPDKTLVVVPSGVRRHGLESHLDWYPGATVARYDGNLPEPLCREWLDGLDVVYTAETLYDWRIAHWAREQHVATVVHAMPEWWRPQWAGYPTAWWAPTTWRLNHLPAGTRHVPVPMTAPSVRKTSSDQFRWLHVAGAQTEADRNGTRALLAAAKLLKQPHPVLRRPQQILIRTQSPGFDQTDANVTVCHENVTSRWDLYNDVDAVVQPRRYAGLSLPVLETLACGLPVVMTDLAPQNVDWPVRTVPTREGPALGMFGGQIPTGDADPHALAAVMDEWATDPTEVAAWRQRSHDWAVANSWEARAPEIRLELERVADLVTA